jgi:hypothetical protein
MFVEAKMMQPNTQPATVTQEMLRDLQRLREGEKTLRVLRDEIRTSLENGALIEPGPLSAELVDLEQRRFTAAALEELFDADWITAIKPELPVTKIRQVHLVCAEDELDGSDHCPTGGDGVGNGTRIEGSDPYFGAPLMTSRLEARVDQGDFSAWDLACELD